MDVIELIPLISHFRYISYYINVKLHTLFNRWVIKGLLSSVAIKMNNRKHGYRSCSTTPPPGYWDTIYLFPYGLSLRLLNYEKTFLKLFKSLVLNIINSSHLIILMRCFAENVIIWTNIITKRNGESSVFDMTMSRWYIIQFLLDNQSLLN